VAALIISLRDTIATAPPDQVICLWLNGPPEASILSLGQLAPTTRQQSPAAARPYNFQLPNIHRPITSLRRVGFRLFCGLRP
jgi:hypothetical protein